MLLPDDSALFLPEPPHRPAPFNLITRLHFYIQGLKSFTQQDSLCLHTLLLLAPIKGSVYCLTHRLHSLLNL